MSRPRPSLAALSLGSLVLGLAGGLLVQLFHSAPLVALAAGLQPIGVIWTNAIRMTVIPIVLTSLVLAVAGGSEARTVGRLGALSLASFLALLAIGGALTALVVPPVLHAFPPGALSLGTPGTPAAPATGADESFVDWLVRLVPTNPFQAAAAGDILPLLVFTVPFALALVRLHPDRRETILAPLRAASEALFTMLRWILWITPLAVFCLTFDLGARTGVTGLGAVGTFVILVSVLLVAFTLLLYAIAVVVGRVPLARFARAMQGAQVLAASTRSSLAALPLLQQGIERELDLPPTVTRFVVPLAVATFRMNRTLSSTAKFLFLAWVYGVPVAPYQVVAFIATAILVSFTTPGVPSAGSIATLPVYLAFGIPVEGVVILNAVEAIPDIFKTVLNVTADGAVTAVVARLAGATGTAPVAVPSRATTGEA